MAVERRIGSHYLLLAGTSLPDLEVVMSRSRWIHWSLLAVPLFLVGCTKGEKVATIPVTGLVTLDGQPVAGAAVSFSPSSKTGLAAVGTTDASGRFKLTTKNPDDVAMSGAYTVIITKTAASSGTAWTDPRSSGGKLSSDQEKNVKDMLSKAGAKQGATQSELPKKYASADTSGFTANVAAGQPNDFTFAMTK
jgi:uncharacterized membrane protein